jgi:hypothetical protein
MKLLHHHAKDVDDNFNRKFSEQHAGTMVNTLKNGY